MKKIRAIISVEYQRVILWGTDAIYPVLYLQLKLFTHGINIHKKQPEMKWLFAVEV